MRALLRPALRARPAAAQLLRLRCLTTSSMQRNAAWHHPEHRGHHHEHQSRQQGSSRRRPVGRTQWQAGLLLACGAYLASSRTQREPAVELSWDEFSRVLLPAGLVDRVEVVGGARVHVHLTPHADLLSRGISLHLPAPPGGTGITHFIVPIPSAAWAEEHLDTALAALPSDGSVAPPPVRFAASYAWQAAWAVAPTLAFGAALLFLDGARQRVAPTGLSWRRGRTGSLSDLAKSLLGARTPAGTPAARTGVTLASVAGLGPARAEVEELVSFLSCPHTHRARQLGAHVPRGALLTGPPGTGKTFLARALAGEAGVPLYACSGSEFSDTYVGVGPARVRELFEHARSNAPSLVFVDEIDALARARGSGQGGCEEREATLNELLVQLDGFSTGENVLVLAATNRPDVLDDAVKRAGRFDRHIALSAPDEEGRKEIFTVHLAPILLDAQLDRHVVASTLAAATPGWSGAEIASVCNDAALLAARRGAECVSQAHLDMALARAQRGPLGPRPALSESEREAAALHTAARIAALWYLPSTSGVSRAGVGPSSSSSSSAPGWVVSSPPGQLASEAELADRLAALLAGRAGETVFLSCLTTASRDELREATELAKQMVARYGMDRLLGPMALTTPPDEQGFTSRATDAHVDQAVQLLMATALERATGILEQHNVQVRTLADALQCHPAIGAEEIEACLGPRSTTRPPVASTTALPPPRSTSSAVQA